MIHMDSDYFYILRGDGNNSTNWDQTNGAWPLTINMNTNYTSFGGGGYFKG